MDNLNEAAERVNRLLNDFEEPIRAMLPQLTRTVKLADEMSMRLATPIDQVVPGLARLADTLNSPVLRSLPTDLRQFMEVINDLSRRMAPLAQLAEQAGGMFAASASPGSRGRCRRRRRRRRPRASRRTATDARAGGAVRRRRRRRCGHEGRTEDRRRRRSRGRRQEGAGREGAGEEVGGQEAAAKTAPAKKAPAKKRAAKASAPTI